MMRLHMHFALPVAAAFGISAACGADASGRAETDPPVADEGSATFGYDAGSGAGTFDAVGAPTIEAGDAEPGTWATGVLDEEGSAFALVTMRNTGAVFDYAVVTFPDPAADHEWAIDPECEEDVCAAVMVVFAMDGVDTATGDRVCFLRSGKISIASLTDDRAKGAFSGTGSCVAHNGGAPAAFSISNGSFDVPLGPPIDL